MFNKHDYIINEKGTVFWILGSDDEDYMVVCVKAGRDYIKVNDEYFLGRPNAHKYWRLYIINCNKIWASLNA